MRVIIPAIRERCFSALDRPLVCRLLWKLENLRVLDGVDVLLRDKASQQPIIEADVPDLVVPIRCFQAGRDDPPPNMAPWMWVKWWQNITGDYAANGACVCNPLFPYLRSDRIAKVIHTVKDGRPLSGTVISGLSLQATPGPVISRAMHLVPACWAMSADACHMLLASTWPRFEEKDMVPVSCADRLNVRCERGWEIVQSTFFD